MSLWVKFIISIAVLFGGTSIGMVIFAYFLYNGSWNHKPTEEEKAEVRSLKNQEKELRKANRLDEAKEISKKIESIQKIEVGDPKRQRIQIGLGVIVASIFATLLLAFPFYLLSDNLSYLQHVRGAYYIVGGACLFIGIIELFNLFPDNNKNSHSYLYALGIHYGALALCSYWEKRLNVTDLYLYLISVGICFAICVIIWLIQRNS